MCIYINSIKKWFSYVVYNPHKVIFLSLLFTVFGLFIITIGPSLAFVFSIAKYDSLSIKVPLKDVFEKNVKPILLKSILMSLLDLMILFLVFLAIAVFINNWFDLTIKFVYVGFTSINLLFLLSFPYRWMILINNKKMSIIKVYTTGILLCIKYFWVCVGLSFLSVTIFALCYITGIGFFFIFPGLIFFLVAVFYKETVDIINNSQYTKEDIYV